MSARPLRFVHTADWALDRPLAGLTDLPDGLRALVREAPFRAAARVIDLALAEEVDFVILAGGAINPAVATLHDWLFLREQVQRLADRAITLYWSPGPHDLPQLWPADWTLPPGVRVLSTRAPATLVHERAGVPLAKLCTGKLKRDKPNRKAVQAKSGEEPPPEPFRIAVVPRPLDALRTARPEIEYWALGGKARMSRVRHEPTFAGWPGSPQSRGAEDSSVHGCWLVEVAPYRRPRVQFQPTDSLRNLQLRCDVQPTTTWPQLVSMLRQRLAVLPPAEPGLTWLVQLEVGGHGPLVQQLYRYLLERAVLPQLRRELSEFLPTVWLARCVLDPQPQPLTDTDVPTLRDAFLRYVHDGHDDAAWQTSYAQLLHTSGLDEAGLAWDLLPTAERDRIWQQVELLGSDLLGAPGAVS